MKGRGLRPEDHACRYPRLRIVVEAGGITGMLVIVRMRAPLSRSQHLVTSKSLIVGREHPVPDGTQTMWVPGRERLSRTSVVITNTGTHLRIDAQQNPGSGEVKLLFPSQEPITIRGPKPFAPPAELGVLIDLHDGLGDIVLRVTVQGLAGEDRDGTVIDEELPDNDEQILLVNALALVARAIDPSALLEAKEAKQYFLPTIGHPVSYDRKFQDVASALCKRYGLDDRRGLRDILRVGRSRGDVRPHVMEDLERRRAGRGSD